MAVPVILAAASGMTSCKKETNRPLPVPTRTIEFILYTNQDFSDNNHYIRFVLHISNAARSIAFDSTVFCRQVKEIPNKQNQLVFEKKVPADESILTAGFLYSIENVGNSWHLETCAANENFKVIEYPFE